MNAVQKDHRVPEMMVARSFTEAEALIHERWIRPNGQLIIRIPQVSIDESLRWERALNNAFQECGCLLGARFGFVALCGAVTWSYIELPKPGVTGLMHLRNIFCVVVLGSALGKVFGMMKARYRILSIRQEIRNKGENLGAADVVRNRH